MKHFKRTSLGQFNNTDYQFVKWLKDPRPWNEDWSLSQEPNGKRSHIWVHLRSKDRNIWPTFIKCGTTIIFSNRLNSFLDTWIQSGFPQAIFGALRSNLFKYVFIIFSLQYVRAIRSKSISPLMLPYYENFSFSLYGITLYDLNLRNLGLAVN